MSQAPNPSGGNPSGTNIMNPFSGGPMMGASATSGTNPLMGAMPSQQQVPPPWSTFAANGVVGQNQNPMTAFMSNLFGGHGADVARGLRDAGIPSNIASVLENFLKGGAGYNPQVLNALFASLQPQVQRGEADILEHFGSMGLGQSSPAAIGLGDYLSQVNLNEGQIAAQLYEQSVQNFMSVLLGGSKLQSQDAPGFWETLGKSLISKGISTGVGMLTGGIGGGAMAGGGSSGSVADPSVLL